MFPRGRHMSSPDRVQDPVVRELITQLQRNIDELSGLLDQRRPAEDPPRQVRLLSGRVDTRDRTVRLFQRVLTYQGGKLVHTSVEQPAGSFPLVVEAGGDTVINQTHNHYHDHHYDQTFVALNLAITT